MTDAEKRAAAKKYAKEWADKGDEKQETQRFWIQLLREVLGVEQPESCIAFELPVKLSHTSFIDAYIKTIKNGIFQ